MNPTELTYDRLNSAYAYFNASLFEDRLPPCLITLQRKAKSYGYFASKRFATRDASHVTDEIALNPNCFKDQDTKAILDTLVHEMCHLEQYHFGTPSRAGYHNKEWGNLMKRVGLYPSHTGKPGGRETGQQMADYVIPGGPFDVSCDKLLAKGFTLDYVDIWRTKERSERQRIKYTCPGCGLNMWAKPDVKAVCYECCEVLLEPGKAISVEERAYEIDVGLFQMLANRDAATWRAVTAGMELLAEEEGELASDDTYDTEDA